MTRRRLESYRSMRDEVKELQNSLQRFGDGDSMTDYSAVDDYRSACSTPEEAVGVDRERMLRVGRRYKNRIAKLQEECMQVEEYIGGIGDGVTSRIFRMYFLEGKTQKEIAGFMHMDRSTVSRRLNAPAR